MVYEKTPKKKYNVTKDEPESEPKVKKSRSVKFYVITTIVTTILAIAGIAAQALYFYQLGEASATARQSSIHTEATRLAKTLK